MKLDADDFRCPHQTRVRGDTSNTEPISSNAGKDDSIDALEFEFLSLNLTQNDTNTTETVALDQEFEKITIKDAKVDEKEENVKDEQGYRDEYETAKEPAEKIANHTESDNKDVVITKDFGPKVTLSKDGDKGLRVTVDDKGLYKCNDAKDKVDELKVEEELSPRSPMRPEKGNRARNLPYESRHSYLHNSSGGGLVKVSDPISEVDSSCSSNQPDWLSSLNISPYSETENFYVFPPPSCSSSSYDGQGRIPSPQEYLCSPQEHICSPQEYICSPQETIYSPHEYTSSPQAECLIDEGIQDSDVNALIAGAIAKIVEDLPEVDRSILDIFSNLHTSGTATVYSKVQRLPSTSSLSEREISTDIPSTVADLSYSNTDCFVPSPSDSRWLLQSVPSVGEYSVSQSSGYLSSSPHGNNSPSPPSSVSEVEQIPDFASLGLDPAAHTDEPLDAYNEEFEDLKSFLDSIASKPSAPQSGDRQIQPKPVVVAGGLTGKERLLQRLASKPKSISWANIATCRDEYLARQDKDGDTLLMILLLKTEKEQPNKLEYVYAMVERLKTISGALTAVNKQGRSALHQVALNAPEDSALLTRYLAEALLEVGAPVDTVYDGCNTLLHLLCQLGDKHCDTIAELLSLTAADGGRVFNMDKYNAKGLTPLLVAVSCHGQNQVRCTKIIRLLISAGADASLTIQEPCQTNALQFAVAKSCDPSLLDALLTSPSLLHLGQAVAYRGDTLLHLVAKRNDILVEWQYKCYKLLVSYGWREDAWGAQGKQPKELVAVDRKKFFR